MKKQWIFASLLSFALLVPALTFAHSATALADGNPEMIVRTKAINDTTFKLLLANLNQQSTRVTVETLQGQEMYSRIVRAHNGYSLSIDLSEAPDSRYILRVQQGDTVTSQIIAVTDEGLLFSHITN